MPWQPLPARRLREGMGASSGWHGCAGVEPYTIIALPLAINSPLELTVVADSKSTGYIRVILIVLVLPLITVCER